MTTSNLPQPRSHKLAFTLVLAGALIAMPMTFLSAAGGGGGGGGGGSSPSTNAPRYNPAEEYRAGIAALDAGDHDAAIDHFKRVTRAARRNPDAQYLLGVSYMRVGNFNRARRPLEAAVRYAPDLIAAKRDLALAYVELERMDDAQEILGELNTRSAACAESCTQSAALAEAITVVETAVTGGGQAYAGPDISQLANADAADALYYQAVGLINEGQYQAALDQLDDAALAFGPHPDILTYQGFANRKLAKFDRAEAYYNDALSIAPNHIGALEYYGELKVERGDIEGARDHLAKIEVLCSFGCYEAEELREWIDNADT